MRDIWNAIQAGFTALGGVVGHFIGGWDGMLYALIIFVFVDYVTGVMKAIVHHRLNSEIGFTGICKKVIIFLLVGIAHVLDVEITGDSGILRTAVIFFYIANEGVSLLENATYIGLPVPTKVKEVLEQLHQQSESEEINNE